MNDCPVSLKDIHFQYENSSEPLFNGLSINLPGGVTSLAGQNGTGKTTLLLLAGGRLRPRQGSVKVYGTELTDITDEDAMNRQVSFVYQNMEFETEDAVGNLLEYVFENGFYDHPSPDWLKETITALEIENSLHKKLQETSKGEMQRIIIAFSLLYGSKVIMMDEPVFALEDRQKEAVLDYLGAFTRRHGIPHYYSLHELDLSRKYSDHCLLFDKKGGIESGTTEKVLSRENVEEAYQVPLTMLKQKETLFRDRLSKIDKSLYEED